MALGSGSVSISAARLYSFMDELGFVILKRERGIPSLAMCERCNLKFFTARELSDYPVEAEKYLWGRFNAHKCKLQDFPIRANKRAVNQ